MWKKIAAYKGQVFDSAEEMLEYAKKWPNMPADLLQFKNFLDERFREACVNVSINEGFTNKMLYQVLRMNTDWVE